MIRARMRQRGAALIAMLMILVVGAAWWTVTAVNTAINRTAEERVHNARILQEAKTALIGHVAYQLTAMTTENNPGRLPCPEAPANIGTANEGIAAGNCTLPAVGRLPWRSLGLDKWRDAAGEPLWYVVSPSWALSNATVPALTTYINSNSTGQLTLDGSGDVVALIIAPGRPLQVQASANCSARVQRRTTPSATIDFRDYLECQNANLPADIAFASNGPVDSFNDQVLAITAAELLPEIEAAVAARFERQFAPQIRTAYSTGLWPATPALPFAALPGNPTLSPFNKYQGGAALTQGFMPVSYAYSGPCSCGPTPCTCTPAACDPTADTRCDPAFVAWSGATITRVAGANLDSYSCSVAGTPATLTCTVSIWTDLAGFLAGNTWMTFNLNAVANNAGMALRTVNNPAAGMAPAIGGIDVTYANNPIGYNVTGATMNADGSATITVNGRLPAGGGLVLPLLGAITCTILGLPMCYQHTISVPMALFSDHPVVDPANTTYNWFYRNNWHQVSWYAVAPDIAPSGARACGANCLTVNFRNPLNPTAPATNQRGLIVIAGRALAGQVRPPATLADWLEGANNDGNLVFAARAPTLMINRSFNDRIAIIDP